jgi:hypothetical protein
MDQPNRTIWNRDGILREFVDWIGDRMGIIKEEDWYSIHKNDVIKYGGSGLLSMHHDSASLLLVEAFPYPEIRWNCWLFKDPPPGYWEDGVTRRYWNNYHRNLVNSLKLGDSSIGLQTR